MQFEYQVLYSESDESSHEVLNEMGTGVWELVAVVEDGEGYALYFKRPKQAKVRFAVA